jgi:pilus assembly protein Flp/PilA
MIRKLIVDERGQGSLEYGLIVALVAIALIAALTVFGSSIADSYKSSAHRLP